MSAMTTEDTLQKARTAAASEAKEWAEALRNMAQTDRDAECLPDEHTAWLAADFILEQSDALEADRAERERLEAQIADLNYALHHADFAAVGPPMKDDGTSVYIGTNRDKFEAARRLRDRGLATITDSAQGPLVARAALN